MASEHRAVTPVAGQVVQLAPSNPQRTGISVCYTGAASIYILAAAGEASPDKHTISMGSDGAGFGFWEPTDPRYTGPVSAYCTMASHTKIQVTEFD